MEAGAIDVFATNEAGEDEIEINSTTLIYQNMNRRNLLKSGLTIAGGSLLSAKISADPLPISTHAGIEHRKLGGKLEVSSIGLGVQNMPRTYETTIPTRKEMINIIRSAYDHGVTLFDTAEAYGPFESERILGEAITSF